MAHAIDLYIDDKRGVDWLDLCQALKRNIQNANLKPNTKYEIVFREKESSAGHRDALPGLLNGEPCCADIYEDISGDVHKLIGHFVLLPTTRLQKTGEYTYEGPAYIEDSIVNVKVKMLITKIKKERFKMNVEAISVGIPEMNALTEEAKAL